MARAYSVVSAPRSLRAGLSLSADASAAVVTFVFLAALTFASVYRQQPPAVMPAGASPQQFSAARAMPHLEVIARTPHATGTREHEEVRDYLLGQLSRMGLSPEVQKAVVIRPTGGTPFHAGTFQNVVARLKGAGGSGKAVLLVAHYDSVPTSPGASDDGAAVAAILETLRALQAGPPLKNDVICLFTDGEEVGLMGAKAFVDEHPWAKEAGVVLNFEARGNGGPVLMFETSDGNGWLVREFARAAPRPVTNSLLYEIYRVLPNDTDLTMFKRAGYAGLNFAHIEGVARYHALSDDLTQLDQGSLQHQGSYALSLARHFGNLNLAETGTGNAVFFDLLGLTVLSYPQSWSAPLAALAALLLAGVIAAGLKKGRLTPSGIALGVAALGLSLLGAAVVVTLLRFNIWALHANYRLIVQGAPYNSAYYVLAFVALTVAVTASLYVWPRRKAGGASLYAGGLLWWMALALVTALYLPGASYLFTIPLLFGTLALGFTYFAEGRPSWKQLAVLYACAIPGVVLCVPVINILFLALHPVAFGAVSVFVVLLLGLLLPLLNVMSAPRPWWLPGVSVLVSLSCIVAGTATSGFNGERPRPSNIFYALNADTGKAAWASTDASPDEWSTQFFAEGIKRGPITEYAPSAYGRFISSHAPVAPLPAAEVTLLGDEVRDGVRTLSVRVTSARHAPFLSVGVDPETGVVGTSVGGRRIEHGEIPAQRDATRAWRLYYYAPPPEGIELSLQVRPAGPVRLRVTDQSFTLPESLMSSLKARPHGHIPTPYPFNPLGDATLVTKTFSL